MNNLDKTIAWTSLTILAIVSLLAFVLSFEALWDYAYIGSGESSLSVIWPIIVDLPILALSIVALYLALSGGESRLQIWIIRMLLLSAILFTVYFNQQYAITKNYNISVKIVAPIAYAVMLEVALFVLALVSKRETIIAKLADLKTKLVELGQERDNLEEQVSQLASQEEELKGTIEQAKEQADQIVDKAKEQANRITGQAKVEADRITQEANARVLPSISSDSLGIPQRQGAVLVMSLMGYTIREQAHALDVSEGTIKNDRSVWNGHLD